MKVKIYLRLLVLSATLIYSAQFIGQEINGLTFSNYSGISGGMLNPALLTGSKVFLDINIVGGSISASNDAAYFLPENKTLLKFIKLDTAQFNDGEFKYNRNYNYFDNKKDKYLATNARVLGPSFMLQYEHHAFGLSTAVRSMHSGNNVPYQMPIIFYEGLEFEENYGVEFDDYDYSFVSMTWSEIGLSYAYDLINYYDNKFTVGLTVKGLFGHEGGYVAIDHANYIIHNSKDVEFKDLDAEIGYALPYNEETGKVDIEPLTKGYGAGIDIGFVFTKKESIYDHQGYRSLCSNPFQDYKYRIGFSILDIGSVTFKEDATLHKFEDGSVNWVNFDTTHFMSFEQSLRTYSEAFYGDPDATYVGDKIKIGLPTTLSLQFDYKLKEKYYVSAMWMQPIRFNNHTLWRPAQINVTPRYETRLIGVSVPLSLYNYDTPRVGLAVRIYTITFGTDWIGSLLGISKFTGMDFYFSMKFNLVKGECFNRGVSDW